MKVELTLRRSGRTTGQILQAIGQAIAEPGATYYFKDEVVFHGAALKWQLASAEDLIAKLDLNVQVTPKYTSGELAFKSLHSPVYSGSDGHIYQRVN
jgi:hypothetical protein